MTSAAAGHGSAEAGPGRALPSRGEGSPAGVGACTPETVTRTGVRLEKLVAFTVTLAEVAVGPTPGAGACTGLPWLPTEGVTVGAACAARQAKQASSAAVKALICSRQGGLRRHTGPSATCQVAQARSRKEWQARLGGLAGVRLALARQCPRSTTHEA